MALEQTLILIKPDALVKSLTGNILTELSDVNLEIVGAKVVRVSKQLAEEHYRHLREEKFFDELIKYIRGHYHTKRVLALVYEGENVIRKMREVVGSTNPEEATPTTIRGKYGRVTLKGVFENAIHASENRKEAKREIKLWFKPSELVHTIYPTKKVKVTKQELVWA
jgi:nucleoside-diphosphate kinase